MALTFHSGFETGGFDEWSSVTGSPTIQGTTKKTGSYAMRCNATGSATTAASPGGVVQRVSAYVYIASAPDIDCRIIGIGTTSWNLQLTTARQIDLYKFNTKQLDGTTVLSTGTWYRISVSVTSAGAVKVYIDGSEEHSSSDASFAGVNLTVGVGTVGTTADLYFDNCVKDNTSSTDDLGDIRTLAARPVGEGTDQDTATAKANGWVDSTEAAVANYTEVNNDPPNTTGYNLFDGAALARYSAGLDNQGAGGLTDLGASDTIEAVNFMWYYATEGGGADDYGWRIRCSDDAGSPLTDDNIDDPKVATWIESYQPTDTPVGANAWTVAYVNSLEMGMAGVAPASKGIWFYEAVAMVAFIPAAVAGSSSISPSVSPSASISPSISPSASLSPSISPSVSPSASVSPSVSPSESPSVSPSASLSPSVSPSESPSVSPSASISPSVSPSASISPSVSPSASLSPSASVSPSVSPSASLSPSISPSASLSPSISPSASLSPSSSVSPSSSESPSPSPEDQNLGESWPIKAGVPSYAAGYNNLRKLARTSNGDLHCVYRWWDGSYRQIHYAKSVDEGMTWVETALTNESYEQGYPSIAVDSNDVIHVVWTGDHSGSSDFQLRYRKYTSSWQAITNLTTESYDQFTPDIAVDSSDVIHVVWWGKHASSTTYNQIRYIQNDSGWSGITQLTTDSSYQQQEPTIAIDSNDYLHVAWNGAVSMNYRKYTSSWQSIIVLYNAGFTQQMPSIAIDSSNNIHVVWFGVHVGYDNTYDQILYRVSLDQGDSFETMERLTDDAGYYQYTPTVSISDDDILHITWRGNHSLATTYYKIRYINNESGWSTAQDITDDDVDYQYSPCQIWALHPTIDANKTNVASTGFAFIFVDNVTLRYFASDDLTWSHVSPSASISPSVSPSASLSPSVSISPSVSSSASISPSVSPSESPSVSPSASISPSVSPSESPSVSPSASLSPSASVSPSVSPSVSISPSVSPSASISPSASVSPSAEPLPTDQDYSSGAVVNAVTMDDSDLSYLFVGQDYTDVENDDTIRVAQVATPPNHTVFLFKDKYTEQNTITPTWNGQSDKAPSESTVYLEILNRTSSLWEVIDSDSTTAVDTDFTLTGTIISGLSDYFDGSFWVACRVRQEA